MSERSQARRVVQLPPSVSERIAAGEVIERPASVVKELVENSLDAGATRIWVEAREGGLAWLKVQDNGCGMTRDDALLSLSRFATSKIREWEDMESLETLGFRGEALASISAVSRLEIVTRPTDAEHGTRVVAQGADPPLVEDAGCPAGTTTTVTRLFFNTPARRKFLKSSTTEFSRIADLLGRLALCRTDVHFRLAGASQESGDLREIFNFPTQYGLPDRLARLWHLPDRHQLALVERDEERVRICGVVGVPPLFANNRTRQIFFVNGRLITSQSLSQALAQGFRALVPERRFPLAVLFIEVPTDEVDVNIHPTKSEVRFLHPNLLFRVVRDAVADALARSAAAPQDSGEAVSRRLPGKEGLTSAFRPAASAGASPPRPSPYGTHESRGTPPRPIQPATRVTPAQVRAAMHAAQPLLPLVDAEAPSPGERSGDSDYEATFPSDPEALFASDNEAPPFPSDDEAPPFPPDAGSGPAPDEVSPFAADDEGAPALQDEAPPFPSDEDAPPPREEAASPTRTGTPPGAARVEGARAALARPPARPASPWRVLAQLEKTYIVCLRGDELWLVDQHAAHERIHYERLAELFAPDRPVAAQALLFPQLLELPPDEALALHDALPVFSQLGYELEPFGGDTFVVRTVPEGFKALARPHVLRQIVADVVSEERTAEPERLLEKLRATTACRASVMAGDPLTVDEMESLLIQLEGVPNASHCPHGRPTWIRLDSDDLARLFHRR